MCATDEVDMCKMRLRLKEKTDESESDRSKINRIVKQLQQIEQNRFETIHMLDEHEVSANMFYIVRSTYESILGRIPTCCIDWGI